MCVLWCALARIVSLLPMPSRVSGLNAMCRRGNCRDVSLLVTLLRVSKSMSTDAVLKRPGLVVLLAVAWNRTGCLGGGVSGRGKRERGKGEGKGRRWTYGHRIVPSRRE